MQLETSRKDVLDEGPEITLTDLFPNLKELTVCLLSIQVHSFLRLIIIKMIAYYRLIDANRLLWSIWWS
jgi:hypothetical protein